MSITSVVKATLLAEYNRAWNTGAYSKQHNGTYLPTGGLFINWERGINWATYDPIFDVNCPLGVSSTQLSRGLDARANHDPQVCLMYLQCVSSFKALYPLDTSFDTGQMGIPTFVDHISAQGTGVGAGDFKPQYTSSNFGGYSNPKGWIYFALLQSYLNLQNSSLITATQLENLRQSTLYAAWTYYNSWYSSTYGNIYDTSTSTYSPSQSLLCAAALLDAAQRWPSDIRTGMFYSASGAAQSPALWTSAANTAVGTILSKGALNSTYNMFNALMNVSTNPTDTVNNAQAKIETEAEACEALVRLYNLTGNSTYLNLAQTVIGQLYTYGIWDATYGGFLFGYDMVGGTLLNSYKETRSTALMLRAIHLYNLVNPIYTAQENAIISSLLNNFYQTQGETGFLYRLLPSFGIFINGYSTAYGSTLAQAANPGDTSVVVAGTTNLAASTYYFLVLDQGVAGHEEQIVVKTRSPLTTTFDVVTGSSIAYTHALGATITTNPPYSTMPAKNSETQYTTEAMGSTGSDLLLTMLYPLLSTPGGQGTPMSIPKRHQVLNAQTLTTNGNSAVLPNLANSKNATLIAYLDVQGPVAGTNPTLTITVYGSSDGVRFAPIISFPVVTGVLTQPLRLEKPNVLEPFLQVGWVIGGTASPSFGGVNCDIYSNAQE